MKRAGRLAGLLLALVLVQTADPLATMARAADAVVPNVTFAAPGGGTVRLADASGLVHLVFVARWCAPCEAEMQQVRRLAAGLPRGSYQLLFVGVNRRQSGQDFQAWLNGLGVDGIQVYDADGSLERALGVQALPWHVVIGPKARVLASGDRAPDAAALQRWAAEAAAPGPRDKNG